MYLPSASSLERASMCVGSAVLPRVESTNEAAEKGRALHAFLARVAEVGRDAALEEVPSEYRPLCEGIDLDVLPVSSLHVAAEVALAYNPETGVARELGRNLDRAYRMVEATEFMGTADVICVGPDELFVGDYKTGMGLLTAARENWQLRFLALAASRVFERSKVRVAIIRILEDGTPLSDSAEFDAVDLDGIAVDLRDLGDRVGRAQELAFVGEAPPLATGTHCRWCKSLVYCPAQTALVKQLGRNVDIVADDIFAALTPEHASSAWSRLKVIEEVVGRVREALYAYAREHTIVLKSGHVVGEVETQRRVIDGKVAFGVLDRMFGQEVATSAVDLDASQASVERALRVVAEQTGGKLAALKRSVMRELEKDGGVTVRTIKSVREHRPAPQDGDTVVRAA